MKVEAAVVTQKRQNSAFNCDSVNINGKVLAHEVIQNGYKGTGVMNDTVFFSVSSSEIEGFADAAVAAFNERSDRFKEANCNPSDVITGYFKDSVYALGEMGHRSSELASSIIYATDNTVILAKTGNTQMYTYSVNGLVRVTPALFANEDGASQYGLCTFPTTTVGDIFLLVSPGVSQVLTDKDIEDICKASEGSVKKIVNLITKVSSAKEGSGSLSAIAVKVTEVDEKKQSPVFGFAPPDNQTQMFDNTPPFIPDLTDNSRIGTKPDEPSENKTKKLKLAVLAAAIVLAFLGCAALGLKLFGGNILDSIFKKEAETTTVNEVTTAFAQVTTTKQAETTKAVGPTTTMAVTTTMPVTTTAPATTASSTRSSSSTRSYDYDDEDDYDDDYDDDDDYEEESGTEYDDEPDDYTPSIPDVLSPIETEPGYIDYDNTDFPDVF